MSITDLIPWKREKKSAKAEDAQSYEIDTFRQDMSRIFDGFLGRGFGLSPFWLEGTQSGFVPRVDVVETNKEIRVSAELPGMDQKDIEIRLDNAVLTIRGEKKSESEYRSQSSFRTERTYGTFSRAIRLPAEVKAEESEAVFENGVLTITLPKATTTQTKTIPVKHG